MRVCKVSLVQSVQNLEVILRNVSKFGAKFDDRKSAN